MTQDEKWLIVKEHYERAYPKQSHHFRERLSDEAVDFLYRNLMCLRESERFYLQTVSPAQFRRFQKLSEPMA